MSILHSKRLWCICCLFVLFGASCLRSLDPTGAPCSSDSDCWSTHFCVQKKCYSTATPELPAESTPEPEPQEEPAPEPVPEPPKEPAQDMADAAPDNPPDVPPEKPADTAPAVGRDLYQPCVWYDHGLDIDKCKPGLLCHRVDAFKAYCLRDCSKDAKVCDKETDRNICRVVGWSDTGQARRACVQEKQAGEDCDTSQGTFCQRAPGKASSICRGKKCVEASLAREGEDCDPKATKPILCDLSIQQVCNNQKKCGRGTPKFEGDPCQKDFVCPVGLECLRNLRNSPICLRKCSADKDCIGGIVGQTQCYQGVCVQRNCGQDFDCQFKTLPHLCTPENGVNRCLPTFSGGERTFGELCNNQRNAPEKEGCAGTLRCFSFGANATSGICLAHCDDDLDCTRYYPKGGYLCSRVPSRLGFRYCFHPCDPAQGVNCPKPLVCGTGKVCQPQ